MNVKANRTKNARNVRFVHHGGINPQDAAELIKNYQQASPFISCVVNNQPLVSGLPTDLAMDRVCLPGMTAVPWLFFDIIALRFYSIIVFSICCPALLHEL